MLQLRINRASAFALDIVNATATHLERIVGLVSSTLVGTSHEVGDLVWEYQDLTGDLRRGLGENGLDNVISIDARRRANHSTTKRPRSRTGLSKSRENLTNNSVCNRR